MEKKIPEGSFSVKGLSKDQIKENFFNGEKVKIISEMGLVFNVNFDEIKKGDVNHEHFHGKVFFPDQIEFRKFQYDVKSETGIIYSKSLSKV